MRRAVTPALTLAAVLLVLVGCGGSSHGATASRGSADPKSALTDAFHKLAHESFRERLTIKTEIASHGLPAADAGLASASPTIHAHGEFENSRRLSLVESVPPALSDAHFVLYDGASYVAVDGKHFRRLTGTLASSVSGLTELGAQGTAKYIVDVKALGAATIDGHSTEHYRGRLDAKGVKSLTHGVGGQLATLTDAVSIGKSQVDVYVDRASGQVVRTTTLADSTIDLGKIAPGGATGLKGKLALHQRVVTDISDAGAKITVKRPHATPGQALALPAGTSSN